MATGATQYKKASITTFFFYSAEIIFALISAAAEYAIYQAYSETGFASSVLSGARAGFMQICIVFFGIAAVKAYQNHKRIPMFMANAATLIFSFVSVWFIHESAQVYAHVDVLQKAYNEPVSLPLIGTLNGQAVDPWLIASLPLFLVGMNWLAPFITMDSEEHVETAEEIQARQERELLQLQFNQQKAVLKAKGRRAQIGAYAGKKTDEEIAAEAEAATVVSEDHGASNDDNSPAVDDKPKIESWRVTSDYLDKDTEYWDAKALQGWVASFGVKLVAEKARELMRNAGEETRMVGPGNGWVSLPAPAQALARQRLRLPKKAPQKAPEGTDKIRPFTRDKGAEAAANE